MGCCGKKTGEGNEIEMNSGSSEKKGKYGEPSKYDPTFNGPLKNRSCTDVICCILFILYLLGMIALGIVAFMMGNPQKLLNSVDSQGNICGYDASVKDKPKLVFFDLTTCIGDTATIASQLFSYSCPTPQVCVEKCPSVNSFALTAQSTDDLVCLYDVDKAVSAKDYSQRLQLIKDKKCAPYVLKSEDVLNRCVPTIITSQLSSTLSIDGQNVTNADNKTLTNEEIKQGSLVVQAMLNLQNLGQKVIADVQESWYWILAGLGIAMVASFIYVLVMRWVAGLLVWVTIYAVLTLVGYSIYYCWTKYKQLSADPNSGAGDNAFTITTGLHTYTNNKDTWYYLTIILAILLGILVLILLAIRKRLQIAIALIKEASRAITHMVFSLFFPIIPWILQMILFGWFVAVIVFLVTSGSPSYQLSSNDLNDTRNGQSCQIGDYTNKVGISSNYTCSFVNFTDNNHLFRMQVYHIFGWFWVMNFIIALGQCVLAGAFASYYWAMDKKTDIPAFPVTASFWRTLRYHTGSLAFGSLIIAIVQMIRAALEYLDHKLKREQEQSEIIKYIIKCMKCCFWCLEKFLKFLNKNAYIEIAVYGKNFCVSAKNAFFLLMRNIVRVVVLDKVTDFVLFIGQLSITGGCAVGSFYWFERQKNLNYYLAPVIIITVGSYMIAAAFFSVYNMAIDTVFLCFLEDLERHDGSPEKPYYMSKSLKKILGKKNKKEESD